jgi:hypothetical protein
MTNVSVNASVNGVGDTVAISLILPAQASTLLQ